MPDYRKRRVGKFKKPPRSTQKKRSVREESPDIQMSHDSKKVPTSQPSGSGMKVIKGKKLEQRRRFKTGFTALVAIVAIVLILQLLLPAGIAETVENLTALAGSGGYPITLESNDTKQVVTAGNCYHVLTNTRLYAFGNNGKKLLSETHGYEEPVLKTSKTRALLFDQGGNEARVYNLRGLKCSVSTDQNIVTGAVSDCGVFALVTRADTYASAVLVYKKNGELLFEWDSATDTVNNVAVSDNGKIIAVSAFRTESGKYHSKISIIHFDSATPAWSEETEDGLIYGLFASKAGFYAVSEHRIAYIHWSKGKQKEQSSDYSLMAFRENDGAAVAVFNRQSDRTDNRIFLFSAKGVLKSQFEWKGEISDIEVRRGHIYCMSDTDLFLFGNEGEALRRAGCSFGGVRISPLGAESVAVVSDAQIERVQLE